MQIYQHHERGIKALRPDYTLLLKNDIDKDIEYGKFYLQRLLNFASTR